MIKRMRIGPVVHKLAIQQEPIVTSTIDVRAYGSFQEALNVLDALGGGILRVPAGIYDSVTAPILNTTGLQWSNDKPLIFRGDGERRTQLNYQGTAAPFFSVTNQLNGFLMEDMTVVGWPSGTDVGLKLYDCHNLKFNRLTFTDFGAQALYADGSATINCVDNRFYGVTFQNSRSGAQVYLGDMSFGFKFHDCRLLDGGNYGIACYADFNVATDGHQFHTTTLEGVTDVPFVRFRGNIHMHPLFDHCWFEHNGVNPGVVPSSWMIDNLTTVVWPNWKHCHFVRTASGCTSMRLLRSQGSGWIQSGVLEEPTCIILNTPTGTDDISLAAPNKLTCIGDELAIYQGGGGPGATGTYPLRITHGDPDGGLTRFGSSKRTKIKALTQTEINALTDRAAGEIVANNTRGEFEGFIGGRKTTMSNRRGRYNVMDFDTPQAAIAATPRGKTLYFPAEEGPFIPPSAAGWDILDSISIVSDGDGLPEDKCFMYFGSGSGGAKNSCIFNLKGSGTFQSISFNLDDCVISGTGSFDGTDGTGDAIRVTGSSIGGQFFYGPIHLNRVRILYPGRSCIYGTGVTQVTFTASDVIFYGAGGHGVYMTDFHLARFDQASFSNNKGMACVLHNCGDGTTLTSTNYEGNGTGLSNTASVTRPFPDTTLTSNGQISGGTYNTKYNAALLMSQCSSVIVQGLNIESWLDDADCFTGVAMHNCEGCEVRGLEIGYGNTAILNPYERAGSIAVGIYDNSFANLIHVGTAALVDKVVDLSDSSCHSNVVLPFMVYESTATSPGRVVMASPHNNIAFVMNRPSGQGVGGKLVGIMLPTLMTDNGQPTSDIDASVRALGLMCYNGNAGQKKLYVYDGTNFIPQT